MRQFGIAVPGGLEHVSLTARTLHETGNWIVLTHCSNAFNTVSRTAVLAEVANHVPVLTPLAAKCYGTRPADVFPDGLRGDHDDRLLQRCPAGGSHGAGNVCLALRPGLKRFREDLEGEGVEAFAYMDDVSLGLMGVTANTVRAFAFLRRELRRHLHCV